MLKHPHPVFAGIEVTKKRKDKGAKGGGEVSEGKEVIKETAGARSRGVSKAKKEVDIDSWLEKNVDELVNSLGLDYLGLSREEYLELLRHPVELLYGSPTSRPDVQTIAKRFRRYSDNIYPLMALALLNIREELSPEHVDFVVSNVDRAILSVAPRLYREVIRLGREDVLPLLRMLWRIAWMEQRSRTLPITCPKCLFNSLTKDMHCLVCGNVVSEKSLKEFLGFKDLLKNYLRSLQCDELRELTRYDYLVVNGNGIKHPKDLRDEGIDVEVMLDSSERTLIRDIYRELCEEGVGLEST